MGDQGYRIYSPPKDAWRCYLAPHFCINVPEGKQPNRFHRWMQRLCFGFRWERIK